MVRSRPAVPVTRMTPGHIIRNERMGPSVVEATRIGDPSPEIALHTCPHTGRRTELDVPVTARYPPYASNWVHPVGVRLMTTVVRVGLRTDVTSWPREWSYS